MTVQLGSPGIDEATLIAFERGAHQRFEGVSHALQLVWSSRHRIDETRAEVALLEVADLVVDQDGGSKAGQRP